MVRPRLLLGLSLLITGLAGAQAPRIRGAVTDSQRVVLRGEVHPLVARSQDLGAVPDSLALERMVLVLRRSTAQEQDLRALLTAQQTPGAAEYHHWLTPAEFGARFGISAADRASIRAWLGTHGLRAGAASPGASVLEISGSAGQLRGAFGTAIHSYRLANRAYLANAGNPSLPAALEPVVAGFLSLNSLRRGSPIQPEFNQLTHAPLLAPGDFATIYNVKPLYSEEIDGKGTTIAVVGRVPETAPGNELFWQKFLPAWPFLSPTVVTNGAAPTDASGADLDEAGLDLTWANALAPAAQVVFVTSASTATTDGVDLSAQYIVDHDLADVMSNSYGTCEASLGGGGSAANLFYQNLYEQAAAEGITVVVSAGDTGAAGCDLIQDAVTQGLGVNALASTPYNVAVGGTEFVGDGTFQASPTNAADGTSALGYTPEQAWNESNPPSSSGATASLAAGGGGASLVYPKPTWQTGTGVPADGARDLPDLSFVASQADEYLDSFGCLGSDAQFYSCGGGAGTSAAAQAFAGIVALIDQRAGGRQGNINPELYALANSQAGMACDASATNPQCYFHDITQGTNAVPCEAGSPDCMNGVTSQPSGEPAFSAGPGYDLATGLGSMNVANIVNAWPTGSGAETETSLTLSPASLTHGQTATAQVAVSAGGGTLPSGGVTLVALPSGVVVGQGELASGALTLTVTDLPGGAGSVIAKFGGGAGFLASQSPPVAVNVAPEPGQTALTLFAQQADQSWLPVTAAPYGSLLYVEAAVTGASGTVGDGGSVTLSSSSDPALDGSLPLDESGLAAFTPSALLGIGSHNFSAAYSGDASLAPSASPEANLTIVPATAQLKASAIVDVLPDGTQNVILGASLASTLPVSYATTVAGNITFTDSAGSVLATAPVSGAAVYANNLAAGASVTLHLPGQAYSIIAHYSGDGNFAPADSPPVTLDGGAFHFVGPASEPNVAIGGSTTVAFQLVTDRPPSVTLATLSCQSTSSDQIGCSLSTQQATLGPGTPQQLTVTIFTRPTTGGLPGQPDPDWPAAPLWLAAAMLATALGLRTRRRGLALLPLVFALAACGGTSTVPQTQPQVLTAGTYHIALQAQAGIDHAGYDLVVQVH